jgi:hypothetical protein
MNTRTYIIRKLEGDGRINLINVLDARRDDEIEEVNAWDPGQAACVAPLQRAWDERTGGRLRSTAGSRNRRAVNTRIANTLLPAEGTTPMMRMSMAIGT